MLTPALNFTPDDPLYAVQERFRAVQTPWKPSDCDIRDMGTEDAYAHQGATLGDTLVTLGDTYEGAQEDWRFLAHAYEDVQALFSAYASVVEQRRESWTAERVLREKLVMQDEYRKMDAEQIAKLIRRMVELDSVRMTAEVRCADAEQRVSLAHRRIEELEAELTKAKRVLEAL